MESIDLDEIESERIQEYDDPEGGNKYRNIIFSFQ